MNHAQIISTKALIVAYFSENLHLLYDLNKNNPYFVSIQLQNDKYWFVFCFTGWIDEKYGID